MDKRNHKGKEARSNIRRLIEYARRTAQATYDRSREKTMKAQQFYQSRKAGWDKLGFDRKLELMFTLAIAVATVVYAVVSWCQLTIIAGTMKATQDSADAARVSADLIRESRRGWILFSESKGPQLPLMLDKQPLITLGFKNFGSGIAKHVTTYVGLGIEPECKPDWESFRMFPSFWKEDAIVVPPGKTLWTTPDFGMTLDTGQISSLSPPKPTNKFCVFGYTSYFDEFGVKHGTMFCLWYNLTLPPDALSYCATDNDAW